MPTENSGKGRLLQGLPTAATDLVGVIGMGLVGYGAWLITPAAGFIVGGVLLVATAIVVTVDRG